MMTLLLTYYISINYSLYQIASCEWIGKDIRGIQSREFI